MLVLKSDIREPTALAFSPDGLALVAVGENALQVWPRWLDTPPRPVFRTEATLERFALGPDGKHLFQYISGVSYTRSIRVSTGRDTRFGVPIGPSWFDFTPEGGFLIVCHGRGKLSRFDYRPNEKPRLCKTWTIDRVRPDPQGERSIPLGSHYAFGGVCGSAGTFVALEYRDDEEEGYSDDGLVVRSVADGALVHHEEITPKDSVHLLASAGLALAIHPSGKYFAYPDRKAVRFRALAAGPVPRALAYSSKGNCRAVAFHPSGQWLAAVGDDAKVKLYDTVTWKGARTFAWDIGELRAVCFSADGAHAAAIGAGTRRGGKVVVWDVDV
jgi:WD40 repeat protein